jgi:hypothetical protein
MKILTYIYLAFVYVVKQIWMFPQNIENAIRQKRRHELREVERLDRIRNPSKYVGK